MTKEKNLVSIGAMINKSNANGFHFKVDLSKSSRSRIKNTRFVLSGDNSPRAGNINPNSLLRFLEKY